MSRWS